jgi:peptidyl-prolyl cis-trans isomerase C
MADRALKAARGGEERAMKHTLISTVEKEPQGQAFSGCSHAPTPAARRAAKAPPIFVNGVSIPETAIADEAQNHRAGSGPEARAAAARALVIRELLLQRARALGLQPISQRDEQGREEAVEEALVRALLAREAPGAEPTEAECRRFYESSLHRFKARETFEASHILVARRDEAESVVAELEAGASFRVVAQHRSACPTGAHGGGLGQLQCGDLAPEIENAVLTLKEGDVAPMPIQSRFGWHIVRLDRHAPEVVLPFEAVRDYIADVLRSRSATAASARYVAQLASAAEIEGLALAFGAPE